MIHAIGNRDARDHSNQANGATAVPDSHAGGALPNGAPSAPSSTAPLTLELQIADPEVLAELYRQPDEAARERYALAALRVGVLALRNASGVVDADAIRNEGQRLLHSVRETLTQNLSQVTQQLGGTLKQYFDPNDGALPQRLDRLVRRDGELERLLADHLVGDDSQLSRALEKHIGEQSPLLEILGPEASDGLVAALRESVRDSLKQQAEQILRQFSLDDRDSAISRLVTEITDRQGKLRAEFTKDIETVRREFSLDNDDGALSRLVRRVEATQQAISREFSQDDENSALSRLLTMLDRTNRQVAASLTLDDEGSPLYRLRRELLGVLEKQAERNQAFHKDVASTLEALKARQAEAQRSTTHGLDFESAVGAFLQHEAQRRGDVYEHVGHTVGKLERCKVGDHVITLSDDAAAAGARIVCESKDARGVSLAAAREELRQARENRAAEIGVFVYASASAPEGMEPVARHGPDVLVSWDAADPATDLHLRCGLWIARALATQRGRENDASSADVQALETAIAEITRDAEILDEITKAAATVRNNGDRIGKRAKSLRRGLEKQLGVLREHVGRVATKADL